MAPPQDKSSDGEDSKGSKGSESEEESDDDDSDEEDRDGDVDQGFREQLMAVLQAGKALVSGGWSQGPTSLCSFSCTRRGCSPGLCPPALHPPGRSGQ